MSATTLRTTRTDPWSPAKGFGGTRSRNHRNACARIIIRLRDRGLDEIVVQPGSRDVERDLRAFADVAASITSQGR
jgi:hypothetical protein